MENLDKIKNIKVSVVLPNFNHENYLKQRIDSILNQTYQDFELIILDDASSDGSSKFLKRYSDHSKVSQVLINKENSGSVFKQWIKGINHAKGEYVWIAESDDYADEKFLEHTVNLLEANDNLGMVFTDSFKVYDNRKEMGLVSSSRKILETLVHEENNIIHKNNFPKYLLDKLVIVNASSVLFKKEALQSVNFEVLKAFKNTGDIFTYVGVALKYNIVYLPEPLNYMRLHEHNTTKKNKSSGRIYKDKILLFDYYFNDLSKINDTRKEVVNVFISFFFLGIDYGNFKSILMLLKKMYQNSFITIKQYISIKIIAFFYNTLMYKGKPYFLRERLKIILKKSF
ncbi:glycosyltransferase family 2 protein [Lacinutrix iliipiscaria]|uniref:Glycosyltransferase family 2 protein n=1 Tax=Lacinutrix iliipiscaria TaxID=1230532 RepID=A0ABW5WKU2_9FLAO